MKKIPLLLLFFPLMSFNAVAQDYMKMKKKQLRIEHQKKLKLIDSLSQELSLSNKENQKIQSDSKLAKGQFEVKLLNYKDESDQLNLELNQLNVRTEYLEMELSKSNKTISELKLKVTNLEVLY